MASARKVTLFNHSSLDGYFAGPNGELDWPQVDDEMHQYAIGSAQSGGGLLFGRVTYELMSGYWPTPAALEADPLVAERMNALPKYVFSRTLDQVDWSNTTLVKDDAAQAIARLKQEPGPGLTILGSANLAASLHDSRLIDEYFVLLNPVVLGRGRPLFEGVSERLHLRLCNTRTFPGGAVLLVYEPAPGPSANL
jgi:dihydrofolate reductase